MIVVCSSWDDISCSKQEYVNVAELSDLSLSSFSPLPRQIKVGVCRELETDTMYTRCKVYKEVQNVCFNLIFPIKNNIFVYSTENKDNSIIFNGSNLDFDLSTFDLSLDKFKKRY